MEEKDINEFPEYDIFCQNIKKLDQLDFSNLTDREIYDKYYDYACVTPSAYKKLTSQEFNSHRFYRVRLEHTLSELEDIELVRTYSYPPANACKNNGRANLANKPAFYCSNDPKAAILESKPNTGDEGFLSVWSGFAKRSIKAGLCLPPKLPSHNYWYKIAEERYNFLKNNLPSQYKDEWKYHMTLHDFLSYKYTSEKNPYPLTSMISNELLYNLKNDLILYPSALSDLSYCNMAFHPNSVDENLKFEKVIRFRINKIEGEKIRFNFGKVGYLEKSRMEWRDSDYREHKFFNRE